VKSEEEPMPPVIDAGEYIDEEGRHSTREKREKERSRTCLKRLDTGAWCILHHAHKGECKGLPVKYGPLPPPADRWLMVAYRKELGAKYTEKVLAYEWVDWTGEKVPAGYAPAHWWVLKAIAPMR
jgi:hypothetical protein